MVIDDGGVMEVGVAWVVKGWVYWYGSGFAIMGVGLGLPPWVASSSFSFVCVCVCVCVLMVDYGLLVVVVSSVCSAAVVGSW